MNQDKKSAYLIELKGSNILYAMDQVISAANCQAKCNTFEK